MRNLWLLCPIAFLVAGLSLAATGQERDAGYYANLGASYIKVERLSFIDLAIPARAGLVSATDGVDFTGSLGYLYDSGMRTEVELSFRRNDVGNSVTVPNDAVLIGEPDANLRVLGGMVNMLYDFDTGSPVLPYLGGGFGVADLNVESHRAGWADGDTMVAFQGLAGVEFALSDDLALRGGYRFFATPGTGVGVMGDEYRTHNIELGLNFRY